ncbi:MAG: PAS domain-containing protein, partial [Anaerolineae bacterium]|nr:PAS domain-containing protein [Anaerolineae bacterium]
AGGPGFWFHVIYSYSLLLIACIMLGQYYLHQQRPYRRQTGALLFGALLPWLSNIISIAGLNPLPNLDLTPIVFTLTGLIYTYNLFHNRFLDLVPIARSQIFDTLQECVIVVDQQQRLVDLNPAAENFLHSIHEGPLLLDPGQPIDQFLSAWPEWLTEGESQDVEWTDLHGRPHVYNRRISTVNDRHGQPQGKVLLLSDITRQKRAEEQERQLAFEQERMRIMSLFLADAAHEFKTPLTVIQTSLYLLKRTLVSDEQLKRVTLIEQQSQLMNRLVEDLMTILRLQDPARRVSTEFDLHQMLTAVAEQFKPQAAVRNIRIVLDFSRVPIVATGDYDQLERAFSNLVDNAVRYSNPGGTVTIQTFRLAEAITIRIADTGTGITPDDLPNIFNSFFRSDTAHTTPGLGLGLSIVKRVIDNHQGQIRVQSQPNEGSTFEITLFDAAPSKRSHRQPEAALPRENAVQ